jgi:hypothetical protein
MPVTVFEFNISQLRNQTLNQTKNCAAFEPSLELKKIAPIHVE